MAEIVSVCVPVANITVKGARLLFGCIEEREFKYKFAKLELGYVLTLD